MIDDPRPTMVLESPPQHGKSMTATDYIAWVAGKNPNLASIYASYSDDLGMKANAALQRTFLNARYQRVFEGTRIADVGLAHQLGITRRWIP